jgi:hypothetical protein
MGIFDWARRVLGPKPAPEPPKKAVLTQAQVAATQDTTQPKAKAKTKPKNAVRIWRYCRASGGRDIYCPHCHTKHSISSMNWSVKTCRHCASAVGQYGWLTVPKTAAEKIASADPAKEGTKWDTGGNTNG